MLSGNVEDYNYGFNLGTVNNGNVASLVATGSIPLSQGPSILPAITGL